MHINFLIIELESFSILNSQNFCALQFARILNFKIKI